MQLGLQAITQLPSRCCSEALNEERAKRQELQEAMQQVCSYLPALWRFACCLCVLVCWASC